MRKLFIFLFVSFINRMIRLVTANRVVYAYVLLLHIEKVRWIVGKWRAWKTFEMARKRVSAYKNFLLQHGVNGKVYLRRFTPDFSSIPEIDKYSYILQYSSKELCKDGRIPAQGVVIDESAGSSGVPTSWVRGKAERQAIRSILQTSFYMNSRKSTFVLNAFSLGAWATGMNISMSLADACIIKSTGPDAYKIIETIKNFGKDYEYVVMGYPPFLKTLADDKRIDLSEYNVHAGFGGEGMSENMRDYLLRSFQRVMGSYGASDLEINIALETEFTLAVRRELIHNEGLRSELTRTEWGIIPMIFQYNPFQYVIEENNSGELLISIAREENLSPRIRYNIHDRGHIIRIPHVKQILNKHGAGHIASRIQVDFPLMFHYGRSDLTVSYYGAQVTPDSVREIIYDYPDIAHRTESFRLISYEDKDLQKHLLFAIEMKMGETNLSTEDENELRKNIIERLLALNVDFASAYKMSTEETVPILRSYKYGEGPFIGSDKRIKNQYVADLEYTQAQSFGLV